MTQEDKQILLKDLCTRLPYNCRVFYEYVDTIGDKIYTCSRTLYSWVIEEFVANKAVIKPYLRPMSSMTEEEFVEFRNTWEVLEHQPDVTVLSTESYDWLNANHFDYRKLIEKNLALDCTGLHIYD